MPDLVTLEPNVPWTDDTATVVHRLIQELGYDLEVIRHEVESGNVVIRLRGPIKDAQAFVADFLDEGFDHYVVRG